MLHALLSPLVEWFGLLNLIQYITVRSAGAAMTAFLLCLFFGPVLLRWLERHGVRERVEKNPIQVPLGRERQAPPTMGGLLLGGAFLAGGALWARFDNNPYTLVGLGLVVFFGAVGLLDDWIKLREEYAGLRAWIKLLLMTAGSVGIGLLLWRFAMGDGKLSHLALLPPFVKHGALDLTWGLGIPWLLWCWLLVAGSGNAVNLTDGLDGLATGLSTLAGLTLAVVCYLAGRADYSSYLYIPFIPGAGEVAVLLAALAGACLGFLWFNCAPALVYMGDTGSLPLGGLLGYAALVCRNEFILLLAGGIFVANSLAVMIQVASFKLFRRRVFPITPLHHIPQLRKMPDNRIVVRYWIVGAFLCMMALATLKIR